ncbi:MAG: hypothetical protein WC971_10285 [Coriobacteriia bacterium]
MMGFGYRAFEYAPRAAFGSAGFGHPGTGMAILMFIVPLLFVGLILWLVMSQRHLIGAGCGHHTTTAAAVTPAPAPRDDTAVAIVRERFARGEIDAETYGHLLQALR